MLMLVSCNGSARELSLEGYFERLVSLNGRVEERGDQLEAQLSVGLENASNEEAISLYRDFFEQSVPLTRDLLDDLRDLDPPPGIREAHERFVVAFEELTKGYEDAATQLENVQTRVGAEEMMVQVILPAALAGEEACLDLEDIAHENGIDVDLECDG